MLQQPFHSHHKGQPVLAGSSRWEVEEDVFGTKFYCPHAVANGNQHIWMKKKTIFYGKVKYEVLM